MKTYFLTASLILSTCFLTGCESDVAADGGRMRMGIHDPIERHKNRRWKWPFQRDDRFRASKPRPPAEQAEPGGLLPGEGGLPPEYQTYEGLEPG